MTDYKILKSEFNQEIKAQVRHAIHNKTGAELLSVVNEDDNKVFAITFKTPVADSLGTPHILEHSVLCGSKKFPLKEPFTEMLKSSLQTFLNAFTYPDRTCYPVASQNHQDFINLVQVYLDAVFNPVLGEHVLKQEGWHYELEDQAGPLTIQGVVYNEMKGAYSDPMNQLWDCINEVMYTNSPYRHDSGGNPKHIPELTYKFFKEFHDKYYHPSNALIFFYGNFPIEEQEQILAEYLKAYDKRVIDTEIAIQEKFNSTKTAEFYFDAGEDEASEKSMHTINWLIGEENCPLRRAEYVVLDYLLLGSSSAVLKKALMESQLGETVIGGGLQNYLREMSFSVGLKGIPYQKLGELNDLILKTLKEVKNTPFRQTAKEAALNTIEFSLRENNTGSTPRGLVLMQRIMNTWIYGADPISAMQNQPIIDHIAACIKKDNFFENLLEEMLLNNKHCVHVTLRPKSGLQADKDEKEKEELVALLNTFNEDQRKQIILETHELKERQERKDDLEVLKKLPVLELKDINPNIEINVLEKHEINQTNCSVYSANTNGIIYLELFLDLKSLTQELLALIPIFSQGLFELGTKNYTYEELSENIDRTTGGTWAYPWVSSLNNTSDVLTKFFVRAKVLKRQLPDLISIWREAFFELNTDNKDRFMQLVKQRKARLESSVVPNGHRFALTRMHSQFNQSGWLSEQWSGVSQIIALRELEKQVENNWDGVKFLLQEIKNALFVQDNLQLHVTCDPEDQKYVLETMTELVGIFPKIGKLDKSNWKIELKRLEEGFVIPSRVNYVGRSGSLYESGYKFSPSILVINHMLRTSYFWDQVRVLGGAYGCFCSFDRFTGIFDIVSYRDPHLERTLEKYDELADYLEALDISEDELQKGIIGVIGSLDSPELPDSKGFSLLVRDLIGVSDEERQMIRTGVLNTKASDFKDLAEVIRKYNKNSIISVVGAGENLKKLGDRLKLHELF